VLFRSSVFNVGVVIGKIEAASFLLYTMPIHGTKYPLHAHLVEQGVFFGASGVPGMNHPEKIFGDGDGNGRRRGSGGAGKNE
jgi:hypothetical protein